MMGRVLFVWSDEEGRPRRLWYRKTKNKKLLCACTAYRTLHVHTAYDDAYEASLVQQFPLETNLVKLKHLTSLAVCTAVKWLTLPEV